MFTLAELAAQVKGRVTGDASAWITGVRPFDEAREGDITLAEGRRYELGIESTRAAAVIVASHVSSRTHNLILTENPKLAFARILELFHGERFEATGISPQAVIGIGCRIDSRVSIGPLVFVADEVVIEAQVTLYPGVCVGRGCRIGPRTTLFPNVTLYPGVRVGTGVRIHSGTVIGADGFGYVWDGEKHFKIRQTGDVVIEDEVEIGANCCVDRATFGSTVIESGVKLDNHVHIGHNCRIGRDTVIVGQVGVSGSVRIGKNCIFAGQSGVVDHVEIGDRVEVGMKSAVSKDVPAGSHVSGVPAMDRVRYLKLQALIRRLPELFRDVEELKAEKEHV